MWYYFDLKQVEKMLKLESQQRYIYLAAADQGPLCREKKQQEHEKSIHQLYKLNRNIPVSVNTLLLHSPWLQLKYKLSQRKIVAIPV